MRVSDLGASTWFYTLLGAELMPVDDSGTGHLRGELGRLLIALHPAESADSVSRNLEIAVDVDCVLTVSAALDTHAVPNTLAATGVLDTVDPDGNRIIVMERQRDPAL